MEPLGGASSNAASALSAVRRADSGVSLGLFSKIAAARKEKLAPVKDDTHSSGSSMHNVLDGAAGASVIGGGSSNASGGGGGATGSLPSHFPEIHDASSHPSRTAASRAPPNPRKVTARTFAQNLRWTKHGFAAADESNRSPIAPATAAGSATTGGYMAGSVARRSTAISPAVRTMQPERLQPQQRRSVFELGTDQQLPIADFGARPTTAGKATEPRHLPAQDPNFSTIRGYVHRSPETLSSALEMPNELLHRRAMLDRGGGGSNSSSIQKPKTADFAIRNNSPLTAKPSTAAAAPETLLSSSGAESAPAHARAPAELPVDSGSSEQELYFAETAEIPGVPIVYRNQKSKATNPERLNMDRRNLPVIPLLEGEQMLRLLNLQNNAIRRIENLLGLPNLIFLDLYNNRVEKLENLHVVPNLRVFMLGKNRLRTIENLECLKKLDVLDLHSNDIEVMQNLNDLRELRVLNLGGNRIRALENIDRLVLLTELNLRRNEIARIGAIGKLPSLQRIFLSNNRLERLEALDPLLPVTSISELRLDGNAVSESNPSEYRVKMIRSFPVLKHLDLRPLSDAERKDVIAQSAHASAAEKERDELEEAHRAHAIACAKTLWERRDKLASAAPVSRSLKDLSAVSASVSAWGNSSSKMPTTATAAEPAPAPSSSSHEQRETKPSSREDPTVHNNQTGFSEIEVRGDYRVLLIYGDALEALESAKMHAVVNAITFRYVRIERVAAAATAATSSNLKLFGRLRRLNFAHNDVQTFEQLLWLGVLGTKAEEVFISHNPVCAKSLLRRFIGARLSNTLRFNGEEITASDRYLGKQLFPRAGRTKAALELAPAATTTDAVACAPSWAAKPKEKESLRSIARLGACSTTALLVTDIFSAASDVERKAAILEDAWRGLLASIVRETLQDIERRDSFMSGCLEGL